MSEQSPSQLIDARIAELGDWRGETLARMRALIREAGPEAVEEWKWRGVPVWSDNGILCTGETYKAIVKLTFARGASLPDPAGLFNASLEGNTRRAIDISARPSTGKRSRRSSAPPSASTGRSAGGKARASRLRAERVAGDIQRQIDSCAPSPYKPRHVRPRIAWVEPAPVKKQIKKGRTPRY